MKRLLLTLVVCQFLAYAPDALAYIGPGLGSGVIASVFGVLLGLLLLVVGAVWYPIKRLIRWLRPKKDEEGLR